MNIGYLYHDTRADEPLQNQIIDIRKQQIKEETELEINEFINQKLKEKDKEIERSNNIINELEKWLESEIDRIIKLKSPKRRSIPPYGAENYCYENMILRYKEVLDKLRELKGKNND